MVVLVSAWDTWAISELAGKAGHSSLSARTLGKKSGKSG